MHNTEVYGNNCGEMAWVDGPEKLNMATYMKAQGYATYYAGKYLNNYGTFKVGGCAHVPPGWDQWYGLVGNSKYYSYTVCTGNNQSEVHGNDYAKDYFTGACEPPPADAAGCIDQRAARPCTMAVRVVSECRAQIASPIARSSSWRTSPRTALHSLP
jgi:arylsulfatase A-like enzyme